MNFLQLEHQNVFNKFVYFSVAGKIIRQKSTKRAWRTAVAMRKYISCLECVRACAMFVREPVVFALN